LSSIVLAFMRMARKCSSAGEVVRSRLEMAYAQMAYAHVPGVVLQLRDEPWARFRRRVVRHHLVVRSIARDEELSLMAVKRRQ
jgi:hypothetical protein